MSSQGFGCSPIKKLRELGSDREEVQFVSLLIILTSSQSESSEENNTVISFFVYVNVSVDKIKSRRSRIARKSEVGLN